MNNKQRLLRVITFLEVTIGCTFAAFIFTVPATYIMMKVNIVFGYTFLLVQVFLIMVVAYFKIK